MSWFVEENTLAHKKLLINESIFHVANGYIGVRGNFEEGYKKGMDTIRGTYINAFHEVKKILYGERLFGFPDSKQYILNVIDAQSIELYLNEEKFSLFEGELISYKRSFNLKEGYTIRNIHWKSPKGREIKIRIKRMTSFNKLELFLINYEIESVNFDGKIRLVSSINGDVTNYAAKDDPRVSSEKLQSLKLLKAFVKNEKMVIAVKTENSKLQACCCVQHRGNFLYNHKYEIRKSKIVCYIYTEIRAKERISLDKYVVYTDSLRHDDLINTAMEISEDVTKVSCKNWYKDQKEYLNKFWDNSNVIIKGNNSLQQGIHYNIYQLLQSVGKDKFSNICAKGLSGEGYEGHYFWDTEIYMFPFFLLTEPEIAKSLLKYRFGILDKARERARELGHKKGALYPWRTITGEECSPYFPAGTAQYHINGDIAYSFIKYYQVTEDIEFIRDYGAEVLFETARLWYDTGHFHDGLFKIDAVTGPDEYTAIVNNNYYTNVMAKYNFKWAIKFFNLLKEYYKGYLERLTKKIMLYEEEILGWKEAYENMYLPYDEQLDINPQDDTFLSKAMWDLENTSDYEFPLLLHYHPLILYRYQVCKQADTVLAHFLLEDEAKLSTIKNSYNYYEKITTHDSSLSSCIFSIMASKIGELNKAYDYFMESARLDLDNTHSNTKDGIHTANMGGTYLAIVYGFAGFRLKEKGISFKPCIPRQWDSYTFKINYKGRRIKIIINKSNSEFVLEKGKPSEIKVYDVVYLLENSVLVPLKN